MLVWYYMAYPILREFVLNSRHPGPRREKWGWELRPLRHFGEIRGLPGLAADEFREANFCRQVADMRAIRPELEVHFRSKSKNMALSGPRHPSGSQGHPFFGDGFSPKGAYIQGPGLK